MVPSAGQDDHKETAEKLDAVARSFSISTALRPRRAGGQTAPFFPLRCPGPSRRRWCCCAARGSRLAEIVPAAGRSRPVRVAESTPGRTIGDVVISTPRASSRPALGQPQALPGERLTARAARAEPLPPSLPWCPGGAP